MKRLFLLMALQWSLGLVHDFSPAEAQPSITGPVQATVISVRDGDTLLVWAEIWPGHRIRSTVRIRGIDAPELRARCDDERMKAQDAKEALVNLTRRQRLVLTRISGGKYYGRVLASVGIERGEDLASTLLKQGYVRPYQGKKRRSWCGN